MLPTSQSLLERLRDRTDDQAWQRLLTVYEPWLRGWLSRHDLQPVDVEDVLQEILVAVVDELPKFVHNGQPGAFRAWLRAILTHRARRFLHRRQRETLISPQTVAAWLDQLEDDNSDLSRQWDHEHDQQLVRRLLASLELEFNAATWQIFRLLVLEGVTAAEVAQRLGITRNAVYVAKARVLTRLRAELRGLVEV